MRETADEVRARLQRIVSCVSDAVLVNLRNVPSGRITRSIAFPGSGEAALSGRRDLRWSISVQVIPLEETRLQRGNAVQLTGYMFHVNSSAGREVLAYHWHPHVPNVEFPHLHISAGAVKPDVVARAGLGEQANALLDEVATAHLPTGIVGLEHMARMLIAHFGVRPRRDDWRQILGISATPGR